MYTKVFIVLTLHLEESSVRDGQKLFTRPSHINSSSTSFDSEPRQKRSLYPLHIGTLFQRKRTSSRNGQINILLTKAWCDKKILQCAIPVCIPKTEKYHLRAHLFCAEKFLWGMAPAPLLLNMLPVCCNKIDYTFDCIHLSSRKWL